MFCVHLYLPLIFAMQNHTANFKNPNIAKICFYIYILYIVFGPDKQIGAHSHIVQWRGLVQLLSDHAISPAATSQSNSPLLKSSTSFFFSRSLPSSFLLTLCLPVAPPTCMALICPTSIRRQGAARAVSLTIIKVRATLVGCYPGGSSESPPSQSLV